MTIPMTKFFKTHITLIIFILFNQLLYSQENNKLTQKEQEEGWILLFDGVSPQQWRGYNADTITSNWKVVDGMLTATGEKGDIITKNQFEDFELQLEYKVSKGGNSGVFYGVKESTHFPQIWRTGVEMQVMDNANNPLGKTPNRSASSLYDMYAPTSDETNPAGEWNKARIVNKDGNVQYWMNGKMVNEYNRWTEKWYNDREACIHNKNRKPLWGEFKKGHIALQDEGFAVAYRNIKVRDLSVDKKKPEVAVIYRDENQAKSYEGFAVVDLLNEWWGATNEFSSRFTTYNTKDMLIKEKHDYQEMFYVTEGYGWAMVGENEFPVYPGACWLVPPKTSHGIRCAETSEALKLFIVKSAP